MATITQTASGTWKAIIHKQGWPTATKNLPYQARCPRLGGNTEDEMIRGVFIKCTIAEKWCFLIKKSADSCVSLMVKRQ